MLVVTLSTNEVKIGTATIGSDTFDVVGLQVATNVAVRTYEHGDAISSFSFTNTYAGPFIGTNLVKVPVPVIWGTNIFIRPLSSNWIYTIPAINQN